MSWTTRRSRRPPAGIHEFELEDCLDKRPSELPYGQRRLVAIARAVAVGASILMLDEPAAGLDDAETQELAVLIRRRADEWHLGVLLIEHNVSLVMDVCDTVTVLDFGREIATGPPEQVRTDPAVIAAYLGEEHGAAHEGRNGVAPSGSTSGYWRCFPNCSRCSRAPHARPGPDGRTPAARRRPSSRRRRRPGSDPGRAAHQRGAARRRPRVGHAPRRDRPERTGRRDHTAPPRDRRPLHVAIERAFSSNGGGASPVRCTAISSPSSRPLSS